jgi:hypothetical protein
MSLARLHSHKNNTIMRSYILSIVIFILFPIISFAIDAQKIKVIQTMIDSAKTQADLNIAAKTLFDVWESELRKKEREVSKSLSSKLRKRFSSSMRSWRRHIDFMSKMRSDLFRLDMMEPRYYKIRGISSKQDGLKKANAMKPYVYNMSRAIYYEDKWIELDVLLNTK